MVVQHAVISLTLGAKALLNLLGFVLFTGADILDRHLGHVIEGSGSAPKAMQQTRLQAVGGRLRPQELVLVLLLLSIHHLLDDSLGSVLNVCAHLASLIEGIAASRNTSSNHLMGQEVLTVPA